MFFLLFVRQSTVLEFEMLAKSGQRMFFLLLQQPLITLIVNVSFCSCFCKPLSVWLPPFIFVGGARVYTPLIFFFDMWYIVTFSTWHYSWAGMGDSHRYSIKNRIYPAVLLNKGDRVYGKVFSQYPLLFSLLLVLIHACAGVIILLSPIFKWCSFVSFLST